MKSITVSLGLVALALSNFSFAEDISSPCAPHAIDLRTDFPKSAQDARHFGRVTIVVTVDAKGKVSDARVRSSSGHMELDRAALTSARRYWRFDPPECVAKADAEFRIAITFERTRGPVVSGTLNRKSIKRAQAMEVDSRCRSHRQTHETTVFACRNSVNADRLAKGEQPSR